MCILNVLAVREKTAVNKKFLEQNSRCSMLIVLWQVFRCSMVIFLVQVSGLSIVTFHIFTDKNTSCTVNDFIIPKFKHAYLQIVFY